MIRVLLILFGLLLGLALAVLTQGRMAHLRMVAGDRLPGWTVAVSPDAGLQAGRAGMVGWRFDGFDGITPRWQLRFGDLTARVTPAAGQSLTLTDLRGSHPLNHSITPGPGLRGGLLAEGLTGSVDLDSGRITTLSGPVELRGIHLNGVLLGDGTAQVTPQEGGWQAEITLTGNVAGVQASLTGGFDTSLTRLSGTLTRGTEMPDTLRRALDLNLPRSGEGWSLDGEVDLRPQP